MITVVLVIHLMLAIALIGVVLIQKSEGGALGMGGGGGGGAGGGGFMTARGTANLLTRTTGILAALFMSTSIILAILSGAGQERSSILDSSEIAPVVTPALDSEPSVPVAK